MASQHFKASLHLWDFCKAASHHLKASLYLVFLQNKKTKEIQKMNNIEVVLSVKTKHNLWT